MGSQALKSYRHLPCAGGRAACQCGFSVRCDGPVAHLCAVLMDDGERPAIPGGAGTELKALLGGWPLRFKPSKDCKCKDRAARMDRLGIEWCEQNIETISGWLREEANKRHIPYSELMGKALIKKAIRRARKKAAAAMPTDAPART